MEKSELNVEENATDSGVASGKTPDPESTPTLWNRENRDAFASRTLPLRTFEDETLEGLVDLVLATRLDRSEGVTLSRIVAQVEKLVIRSALKANGGRKARTAVQLGMTREGLYKKMKRLNVE
jgi:DNA-binding NtrC family response regulator